MFFSMKLTTQRKIRVQIQPVNENITVTLIFDPHAFEKETTLYIQKQ